MNIKTISFLSIFICAQANAQNNPTQPSVRQTGAITANHLAVWNANQVIKDGGVATSGTVTTTGSPSNGNLTKFSGATSITNTDLTGDITTSGTLSTTVAKIAGVTVSGTTGATNVVFSGSPTIVTPTITTSATVPLVVGGTGAASTLTLESTSGSGTTDAIIFKTASQNEAMRIDTNRHIGIGTATIGTSTLVQGNGRVLITGGVPDPVDGSPAGVAITSGTTVEGFQAGFIDSIQTGVSGFPLLVNETGGQVGIGGLTLNSGIELTVTGKGTFSNSVGIGTASPATTLDVNGGITLEQSTSGPVNGIANYFGLVSLWSGNVVPFAVDSSGDSLFGANLAAMPSPTYIPGLNGGGNFPHMVFQGVDSNSGFTINKWTNNSEGSWIGCTKNRANGNAAVGTPVIVVTGDSICDFTSQAYTGTQWLEVAGIYTAVEGTVSSSAVPGTMTFKTANAAGTATTGLKIDSTQAVTFATARKGTFICTGAGTITISNTNMLATSNVIISMNAQGGTITTSPAMKTVTGATGFTVVCGATDTSTYNYVILN